jgi:hypothetical protein
MTARALLVVLALAGCAEEATVVQREPARERPRGAVADCEGRSEAAFEDVFADKGNLVVGPFALVGAMQTSAETIGLYGGDKLMAIVRDGHRVTVAMSRKTRKVAALAYGPLPQGEIHLRDGHRVVTFAACAPGGPSGSTAGGAPVTFWSGFLLAAGPGCVPLRIWVDDEPAPRRAEIPFGVARCA